MSLGVRGLSPTRSASNGCARRFSPSAPQRFKGQERILTKGGPNSSRSKIASLRRPPLTLRPFASLRVQAARAGFLQPHRGTQAGDGPAAHGARREGSSTMATVRSKSAPKRETRTPVTFQTAVQLCPHQGVAENVAQAFGLIVPEYEAIRAQHSIAVKRMAEPFEGSLNDKATAMHFQRIVGSLVSSAVGAGRFYSEKVSQARDATARAADGGNDELGTPIGLDSRAQRTREFAADMAMQAFALLAAAHGAIDAYRDLTGEDWKAYETSADATVEKKAAASQMGAFGG